MKKGAFWQTNSLEEKAGMDLKYLEKILTNAQQVSHPLSAFQEKTKALPWFARMWNNALGLELSEGDWIKNINATHNLTGDNQAQEKNYKIISRWYRCPADTGRYVPLGADVCWRCQLEKGDLLHLWWECPLVKAFWESL